VIKVPTRTQPANLTLREIVRFQLQSGVGRGTRNPVVKEAQSDAELEDMILQRLLIGGVFVSVRRDPVLGWRPTVITAPKHTKNAQELADKIAAELRKKFTLKE
jgi:hypothetical protein